MFPLPFLLRIECSLILIVLKLTQNSVLLGLISLSLWEKLRFRRDFDDFFGADWRVERMVIHEVSWLIDAHARQNRASAVIRLRIQVHALSQAVRSANLVDHKEIPLWVAGLGMSDLLL